MSYDPYQNILWSRTFFPIHAFYMPPNDMFRRFYRTACKLLGSVSYLANLGYENLRLYSDSQSDKTYKLPKDLKADCRLYSYFYGEYKPCSCLKYLFGTFGRYNDLAQGLLDDFHQIAHDRLLVFEKLLCALCISQDYLDGIAVVELKF